VNIPVVGNGDVFDADTARLMFSQTGVDGIMLARGTLGNPWLFREILQSLQKNERFTGPDLKERFRVIDRHYKMEREVYGDEVALKQIRKHFGWYLHGLPHAAKMRNLIFRMNSYTEIKNCFNQYLQALNLGNHTQVDNIISGNN
jgi:tRNA-dihydrouridine synthase